MDGDLSETDMTTVALNDNNSHDQTGKLNSISYIRKY